MSEKATNEIVLKLSIKEANILLKGLGKLAYEKSYMMVNKIQHAATVQLGSNGHAAQEPVMNLPETEKK